WTLDQVGNWDLHKLDLTGDGDYIDTGEFQDDRSHNVVNELTSRALDTNNDSTPDITYSSLGYDAAGNLTDDKQDYKFIYDPLGRLVRINNQSDDPVSEYRYDGLGRRIAFRHDTNVDGDLSDETWYHIVCDDRWRIV